MTPLPRLLALCLSALFPAAALAQGTAELRVLRGDGSDWTSPPLRIGLEVFNYADAGPCAEPFDGIVTVWTDDTFAGPHGSQVRLVASATVDWTGLRLAEVTLDGRADSIAYWPAYSGALGAADIDRQGGHWRIEANFIQATTDGAVIILQIEGQARAFDALPDSPARAFLCGN